MTTLGEHFLKNDAPQRHKALENKRPLRLPDSNGTGDKAPAVDGTTPPATGRGLADHFTPAAAAQLASQNQPKPKLRLHNETPQIEIPAAPFVVDGSTGSTPASIPGAYGANAAENTWNLKETIEKQHGLAGWARAVEHLNIQYSAGKPNDPVAVQNGVKVDTNDVFGFSIEDIYRTEEAIKAQTGVFAAPDAKQDYQLTESEFKAYMQKPVAFNFQQNLNTYMQQGYDFKTALTNAMEIRSYEQQLVKTQFDALRQVNEQGDANVIDPREMSAFTLFQDSPGYFDQAVNGVITVLQDASTTPEAKQALRAQFTATELAEIDARMSQQFVPNQSAQWTTPNGLMESDNMTWAQIYSMNFPNLTRLALQSILTTPYTEVTTGQVTSINNKYDQYLTALQNTVNQAGGS
jgi:hypothetical protein